jgi:hypothetical protein
MRFSYQELQYAPFGKVLAITHGETEMYVSLDFGPRILRYALTGGENFMFEDQKGEIVEKGPAFDEVFYPGAYWRNYAGHRIWLTPESMPETYIPDNDPVSYEINGQTITFTPPAQKALAVQEQLVLTFLEDGSVEVNAKATNIGDKPATFGIWQVTVMCKNGLAVVPQNTCDTGLLHNRTMSLWPYCDMSDARVSWGKTLITLEQNPENTNAFKIGTRNCRGFSAYLCHNAMFVKRFACFEGVNYPDDGCNFEMYTNQHFLELESLGPLASVSPGDTISQSEYWSITPGVNRPAKNDFAALEKIVAELVEND